MQPLHVVVVCVGGERRRKVHDGRWFYLSIPWSDTGTQL